MSALLNGLVPHVTSVWEVRGAEMLVFRAKVCFIGVTIVFAKGLLAICHIEVLFVVLVVGDGAFSAVSFEEENFSPDLQPNTSLMRVDYEVVLDEEQRTELGFVVFKEELFFFEVVDEVGMMPGDGDVI